MEEGGSAPKLSNLHQFRTASEGPLTLEEAKFQMQEIKRLAELKAEKEKSEKKLKKVLTPKHRKAHEKELATYEAKRANMLEEYNHWVFVKENVVVDRMHKNLVPPEVVVGSNGLVIKEPESWSFVYNGNFDLVFQREKEFHLATTAQMIRVQNSIKTDYVEAREMFDKMIYVTKARNDVVE
ncbi:hypothetical protein Tco_0068319, partial [Tanacetum coccineum]